jgi:undecaprenyl-diphosphatase
VAEVISVSCSFLRTARLAISAKCVTQVVLDEGVTNADAEMMSAAPSPSSLRVIFRAAPRELQLLALFFVVALLAWGLALLVASLEYPRIQRFDERVLLLLRRPGDLAVPVGPTWLLNAARDLSALGSTTVLTFMVVSVAGYLLLERRMGMLGFVLAATCGGGLIVNVLKPLIARPRPHVVPHLVAVHSESFPSGHSLLSAAVYLTLGALLARVTDDRITRIYLILLAALLTIFIGLSRVYLGVHYPTDVLGGWVGGLLWALACGLVARELQRRHVLKPDSEPVSQRVSRTSSVA